MQHVEAIIVGGGPCGLSAAIELQNIGIKPIVIEKGNVVNAIYNYPTHQTFFSSSEKLAIGDVPFLIEERKPRRNQALVYYREVVKMKEIQVNRFEKVESVVKEDSGLFTVKTDKEVYCTPYVILATGYYDQPNYMDISGEDLPKVFHYFKEAHPFFDTDVLVIGGKNSAVDAALELRKAKARVTVAYRGGDYSPKVKPWILPEFASLVKNDEIAMHFNTLVKEIRENEVVLLVEGEEKVITNDFVFAMTGYHPNHGLIRSMGVNIDEETGRPHFDPETMETNIENLFIAGVLAAGNNANEIFIENGRFHGEYIAKSIMSKKN
ncbi:YpdA family putative bacillithiol disulfide reductase [Lysinibacillus yapensis]|uniref:YpdA family putative bacillithiol disulfide reductase n=1 Tax=Ureibacillus yapensis TaxID=2304605 RepID=A0A396SDK2_9BACL|nr:YpdA family putative bacillithiol disulfide reductase [Lysinibacillus yapensis]RHW39394.1 YpdA family putative bacillithiol disulfide reductase [Lysinibacillus yapensis]